MQSDQQHLHPFPNPPFTSFFDQNVDFQPSKICPRNFIIFDRSDNRSQVMYHPGTAPGYIEGMRNDENAPREVESIMEEDSADIDLLMSFEEEEEDEGYEEEEEVSTARTHGNDEIDTADSSSSRLPETGRVRGRGSRLGLSTVSCKSSGISDRKCREMKKMVDSLRGIVPGSKRMNTVDVLDEAVKYLKSLKVELQKVGVANMKS